ncbi:4571_t:CDS:2 [Dentiscutata erythropus]|uniref:4571_t:CDS:1 n=1 Tax=Dentiscutata erythropus TaxID=1348616 RepID=A0A9N9B159_9GLOM|nr:4571_t:CDS:2 [Dentiscutata erythropus]
MGRLRRSRTHKGIRDQYRKQRTRNYTKDLDQIHKDLKDLKELDEQMVQNQESDPDLPGFGKYPCKTLGKRCFIYNLQMVRRYFINQKALDEHNREVPYTQSEAEAAVGYSTEHSRIKVMKDISY